MINVIILTAALSTISADVNQQMASEMTITDKTTLKMELEQQINANMATLTEQLDKNITESTFNVALKLKQIRTTYIVQEKSTFIVAE
ncbi:hypothetical protein TUM4261_31530 [Shewanella sp. c952]|uniref:hypothetical protein n=1 Tax=Shewanella sp. c952 TaxID=2815913 RepID=UPI001BC81DE3|nr:hypothetical protein [Shewanella sp. c952]GIU15101.1 hypothetical protein TUM4261_31530 [Shewanella sp. c952]